MRASVLLSISAAVWPCYGFTNVHRKGTIEPRLRHDMFTGIVEEMGTVVSLEERDDMVLWDGTKGKGTELIVKGDVVMDGAYLG